MNPSAPSGLLEAQVIAIQPPNKLLVLIPSWGAGTRVPVTVMSDGQCDALRVQQKPLPKTGTWGAVQFIHQDSRNGVWIGAYPPALANAYVSGDPDITYVAENSGHWIYRDGQGNEITTYADGTTITVGAPAPPTRTIVEGQSAVTQEVTQGQRATLKGPMSIQVVTSGGVTLLISGTTVTLTGNLNVIGSITATGNITAGEGTGDQVDVLHHTHPVTGISTGSSTVTSGAPTPGS